MVVVVMPHRGYHWSHVLYFIYIHFSFQLIVTKQKDKSEVFFRRLLKEDKGAGQWEGVTYIEFLCQVHREIKEILS